MIEIPVLLLVEILQVSVASVSNMLLYGIVSNREKF